MDAPGICPHCGNAVPENAAACPRCGADERTAWNEVQYDEPEVMDDDEYADALRRTFGAGAASSPRNIKKRSIVIVALVMVIVFILYYVV